MTLSLSPGRPRQSVTVFHTGPVSASDAFPDGLPGGFMLQMGASQAFLTEAEAIKLSQYIESASHATA